MADPLLPPLVGPPSDQRGLPPIPRRGPSAISAVPAPIPLPPSAPLAARQRQVYAPARLAERQAGPVSVNPNWAAFLPFPVAGPAIAGLGAATQFGVDTALAPPAQQPAFKPSRGASAVAEATAFHPEGAMQSALAQRGIQPEGPVGRYYVEKAVALRDLYDFIDGLPPGESMPMEEVSAFLEGYLDASRGAAPPPDAAGEVVTQTLHDALSDSTSPIYAEVAQVVEQEGPWGLWRMAIEPIAYFRGYDTKYVQSLQRDFAVRVSQYDKALYEAKVRGETPPTFQQFLAGISYRV